MQLGMIGLSQMGANMVRHARSLQDRGIHYVNAGTSGGTWGLDRGYCLMIGGPETVVKHLDPIFHTLAPGRSKIPRTLGQTSAPGTAEEGYLHCGPQKPDTSSK